MSVSTRPRQSIALAALALAFLVALGAFGTARAGAAAGELDASFGETGTAKLFGGTERYARAIAVQPDGKVLLAGSDQNKILVARLLDDGTLDPSFGAGGVVATAVPGEGAGAHAVAIQPDGKIVVTGTAIVGKSNGDVLAARYLPTGAPDPSFGGGDGIQIVPVGAGEDEGNAVAIGADGRILIVGTFSISGTTRAAGVVVLRADGEPETSFAGTGYKVFPLKSDDGDGRGAAVAGQPDGAVLVGDSNGSGGGDGFTLLRVLPSGALDTSFGGDGVVEHAVPGTGEEAGGQITDLALQPDGRIVAAGYAFDRFGPEMTRDAKWAVSRFDSDGELDSSFGSGGDFSYQFDHFKGSDEQVTSVALTASGQIVLVGSFGAAETYGAFGALRLGPTGALDPTFGSGGVALGPFGPPASDYSQGGALDAQGRLLVLSSLYEGETEQSAVTRYLGDPLPDLAPSPPAAATTGSPSTPGVKSPPRSPHARLNPVPRSALATKLKGFGGTATDPDGDLVRVQISLERIVPKGKSAAAPSAKPGRTCRQLKSARGRFATVRAKAGAPCPKRWLGVGGTDSWSFALKAPLPPGRYVVAARALDATGATETAFSRKAGNRYSFRLTAPPGR